MAVPASFRTLLLIVPALLLCLGGTADAQRQRAKTGAAKTAKVRAPKAKVKAAKTGRTKIAKVTLAGTRKTAKKTVAEKTVVKKTVAKKTVAKKAVAKKAVAKKAVAKKAVAKKAAKTATTTRAKKTATGKASKESKALTQKQRETIAVNRVLARGEVLVSSTPFNGDVANPITGLGPIEIQVRKQTTGNAGRLKRFFRMLSPSAERSHLVMVDAAGNATKLSTRPNSPFYRAFDGIRNTIPVREILHDVINSSGVRNGLFTAILGGAATAINPVGSVGIFRGVQLMFEGVKRRTVARNEVFAGTVKWANRQGARGKYPNLTNTYRRYKTELQKNKPGTEPATLKNFAELLAGSGL